jgi:transposase
MPTDEELDALIAQLDPAARIVIGLFRKHSQALLDSIEQLKEQQQALQAQNAELRRMLFGPRSEKMPSMASEVRRALEANELIGPEPSSDGAAASESNSVPASAADAEKKRRDAGRKRSEAERQAARAERKRKLPVLTERINVAPEQLPQGYERDDFRVVGPGTIVRRYEHVREHLVAVDYVLETLASKDGLHIVAANSPPSVQEGGLYGPGVYARIVVAKTDDSLPLHRIAKIFARDGAAIAASTLGALFHRAAELLAPVYTQLVSIAHQDPYINADETRMPVQAKKHCRTGWIWTFITKTIIVYKFSATRSASVAEDFLQGTPGTLQIDGYSGYASSCDDGGRERVGCWSHARRGFFKCRGDNPEVDYVLERIVQLYLVEYQAAEQDVLGTERHADLRTLLSTPITDEIIGWCRENGPRYNPKSPVAAAINYVVNQWATLIVFLKDPRLRLDNNVSERALRIHALGRKSFLFVGHDEAGQNLAVLQTIVATCKLHNVNPYDYLVDILIRVQTHPQSRIAELLPMNWTSGAAARPAEAAAL